MTKTGVNSADVKDYFYSSRALYMGLTQYKVQCMCGSPICFNIIFQQQCRSLKQSTNRCYQVLATQMIFVRISNALLFFLHGIC